MNTNNPTQKHSTEKLVLFGMIAASIIFIVIALRIVLLLLPEKIPLDKFISLELSGYNTVGEAKIVFDYNSFIEQYGEKIKFKNDNCQKQFIQDYPEYAEVTPAAGWLLLARVGLSQYTGLSNGDSLTLKSNSADSTANTYFNCIADYDGAEYVVAGLEEPAEIDILKDLTISFKGCSPDISVETAKLSSKWDSLENLNINISKSEHLADGEDIEISLSTIDNTDVNIYLATCGYKPAALSQTFKASGDGHYIASIDEIPVDIMEQLHTRSEEIYTEYLHTKDGFDYQWTHDVNSIQYVGSLLLTSKDLSKTTTPNTLYLVYEANTYITAKPSANSRTKYKNNAVWYFITKYDSIALAEDGTCNMIPDELSLDLTGEVGFSADDDSTISEIYYGYATLDDVSLQLVEPYAASYDCESRLIAVH